MRLFSMFTSILLTMLIISFPYHHSLGISGITLNDYMKKKDNWRDLTLKFSHLGTMIFLPKRGHFNDDEAMQMINRINRIDPSIMSRLKEQGIKIKLFTGKLTEQPSQVHLKGKSPRGWESDKTWDDVPGIGGGKVIYIKIGHSFAGMGHGSINLELHEIAHTVDRFVFDEIRSDPVFLSIWKEEAPSMFKGRDYFIHFPEEYFAESFAQYYLNEESKNKMKKRAPHTYSYIMSLENEPWTVVSKHKLISSYASK